MSRLKMAAVAAALAFAPLSPALAQEAAAPAAPAAPAPQMSPADMAFQAQGQAFEAENQKLMADLTAIMGDASLDKATKTERTSALIDANAAKFQAFADVLKGYLTELANRPERTAERDQILQAAEAVPAQVANVPNLLKESIQKDLAAQP